MKKVRVWFPVLLCSLALAGVSVAATTDQQGSQLLEQRCSVCHPAARPMAAKKTPEQWDATVARMIGKGARLSEDEKQTLVDYLSRTYKP
jgi:mono/diheme cytochrome c family protein